MLDNGLRLAETNGADRLVVALFAVFHDACRRNDDWDPEHGPRASTLVEKVGHLVPELDAGRRRLLVEACHGHTNGGVHADPTIGACWDADRLDLGRVGIRPRPDLLSTEPARAPEMIERTTRLAIAGHVHDLVLDDWLPHARRVAPTS